LKEFPDLMEQVTQNKDSSYVRGMLRKTEANRIPQMEKDKGLLEATPWYDPKYTPKAWKNIHIPGYWEDQGLNKLNGVVWYRREIRIPASMTGTQAKLFMGRIVDADRIYVNGKEVGNIGYQYPPRRLITAARGALFPINHTT
jgi:sialate O-acetylesterase